PLGPRPPADLAAHDPPSPRQPDDDEHPLQPSTLLLFRGQLQFTLGGGDDGFATFGCFRDNRCSSGSTQCLAELGHYLAGHLAAGGFNSRTDSLKRLVEGWGEPVH